MKRKYSKARALTRIATPETDAALVELARAGTAAHIERIVRGCRRYGPKEEHEKNRRLQDSRYLLRGLRAYDGAGDKAIDSILLQACGVCLTQMSADQRFEGCKPYRSRGHGSSAAPLSPPLAP